MKKKKVAFITGASKGVGRGIAYGMAEAGWDLAINYHSDAAGAKETLAKVEEMGQICRSPFFRISPGFPLSFSMS